MPEHPTKKGTKVTGDALGTQLGNGVGDRFGVG